MTQKFWVILYWFSTPNTVRKVLARPKHSAPLYKTRSGFSILTEEYLTIQIVSPTDSSATHIRGQRENLVCRNHAGSDSYRGGGLHIQESRRQQQSPLSSGCFASGIPQGRHLQMPGRSWRAGQPSGDGKPVGPDVPLENGFSGINKSSSDDRPGPCICNSKYVEDAKAARSVRVWDRVPIK